MDTRAALPAVSTTDVPRNFPTTAVSRPESSPAVRPPSAWPQPQQGLVGWLLEQLQDDMPGEIASPKNTAVGVVLGTLREMVQQAIPTLPPYQEAAHSRLDSPASQEPRAAAGCKVQRSAHGGAMMPYKARKATAAHVA